MSVRSYAATHHLDGSTVSRYLSGDRMPPWPFVVNLQADNAAARNGKIQEGVLDHLGVLYVAAVKAKAGSEAHLLRDELVAALAEREPARLYERRELRGLGVTRRGWFRVKIFTERVPNAVLDDVATKPATVPHELGGSAEKSNERKPPPRCPRSSGHCNGSVRARKGDGMTLEVLIPVLLALGTAVLHLIREVIRRDAARRVEETRARMLVDLAGHCGPDAVLVDRRPDGAVLTVRAGAAAGPVVPRDPQMAGRGARRG
ncbi:hypothetical protein ABT083_25380 [Streptomyces goshikiensis]|uniref:hypothetical protein n=1 Tax=Streptomyces goshikiensis TaxID=1942 RepID=UPI003332867A